MLNAKARTRDWIYDVPPNSLRNPNVGLRTKQYKKKIIGACSLICNILGVGGHAAIPG
jgi:hypothetical protein